ncbi:MAG TPA: SDR family NAD(P)-dependent oxidoreductase [Acidimicrobiales bacterium]|nr:SDR family NAD(P)-dependent oxidoreductase [Acidimicrobiales bacterium]
MDTIEGKVAVVTGAASGIGRALARRCAAGGASVVLADVEEAALEAVAAELAGSGAEVLAVPTDVSDGAAVDALRDTALDRFGAVHLLCNNAGVSIGGPMWEHTTEDWEWVLGVNLWGVVHGVRAFTPTLLAQGEGHIVNTASMAGLVTPPFMGIYNVTKHAVVALSETLHGELALAGSGVGVSVLCPGWVTTRIHEADRNRPGAADRAPADQAATAGFRDLVAGLIAGGIDPDHVADLVLDAVRTDRFYVLTHPEWRSMVTDRAERIVTGQDPSGLSLPMEPVAPS